MSRQSRIDTTGAVHHIIARAIERRNIFDDDQARYGFLRALGLSQASGWGGPAVVWKKEWHRRKGI